MKIFRKIALALNVACVLISLPLTAHAQKACASDVVAAVAKSTGIKKSDAAENMVVSEACKVWPHDRNIILSAFAFHEGTGDAKILVVAMVDGKSRRVISSYKNVVTEDSAVHFGQYSLGIDAAPYQLAAGTRAFGVRFSSDARGPSCADGAWDDELTLYVPAGATLRPVLQGLAMMRSEARKGCFGGASAEVVYDEARLSLSLTKTSSNGYADLIASARITREGDGTPTEKKPIFERRILRYDGRQYREDKEVPWWLIFFRPE